MASKTRDSRLDLPPTVLTITISHHTYLFRWKRPFIPLSEDGCLSVHPRRIRYSYLCVVHAIETIQTIHSSYLHFIEPFFHMATVPGL